MATPYQKLCFTPPFATGNDATFTNCVQSYSATGACMSNAECAQKGVCRNGACSLPSDFTPTAVATVSPQTLSTFVAATQPVTAGGSLCQNVAQQSKFQCKHNLIETVVDGRRNVMCPVSVAQNVSRNCVSALKSVWQCDRFKARGNLDEYNKCRQMEACFQYNIKLPDGNEVPVAVKANDMCLAASAVALQQAGSQCVNGPRATCTTRKPW